MKVLNIAAHIPAFEEIVVPIGVLDGRERFARGVKSEPLDVPRGVAVALLEQTDAWAPADAAAKAHVKAVADAKAKAEAEAAAAAERARQAAQAAHEADVKRIEAAELAALDADGAAMPPAGLQKETGA